MRRFTHRIVVQWSREADAYVARVPELEFVSARGDTPEDAVKQVRLATLAVIAAQASRDRGGAGGAPACAFPPPLKTRETVDRQLTLH